MSKIRELRIIVSDTEYSRLQREAQRQSRTTGLQAQWFIRQGLGLVESDTPGAQKEGTRHTPSAKTSA